MHLYYNFRRPALSQGRRRTKPIQNKFTDVKGVCEQTCLLNAYSLALRVCNDKPTYDVRRFTRLQGYLKIMFSSFKCRNCKCIGLLLFTSSFLLKKDKEKSEDNWDQPSDNDEVLNGLKAQTWRRLALSLSLGFIVSCPWNCSWYEYKIFF